MQAINKYLCLISIHLVCAFFLLAGPSYAGGAESFDDAVSVLNVAVENDDMDAIVSLLHEEIGLDVAGNVIQAESFPDSIYDPSDRDFVFVTRDGTTVHEMSFEDFFRGNESEGVFTRIDEVNLTHYIEIDRDELFDDATMALWEHGELECAVVNRDEGFRHLYIFPDLTYRLSFEEIDGFWYLTRISARME